MAYQTKNPYTGAADKVKEQIQRAVAAGAVAEEVGPKIPADSAYCYS